MKKSYRKLTLGLSLSMMLSFGGQVSAQKTGEINIKFTEPAPPSSSGTKDPCESYKKGEQASESFKLYYIRSAPAFKTILDSIVAKNSCLKDTVIGVKGQNVIVVYIGDMLWKKIGKGL